jgi:hypothetical protein
MSESDREMLAVSGEVAEPPTCSDASLTTEASLDVAASPANDLLELSASSAGVMGGKVTVRNPDGGNVEMEGFVVGVFAVKNIHRGTTKQNNRNKRPSGLARCRRFLRELAKHHIFATILERLHQLFN